MRYEVRALSPDHLMTQLVLDAQDEDDARRQAATRGLAVAEVRPAKGLRMPGALGGALGGATARQWSLVLFSQELLALLRAGLSIVEGLEALLEKEANETARAILQRLLAGLRDGKRLSVVLAEQPAHFPPLYVGIVRAAEGTSDLPRSLARYLDYRQRVDGVRGKVVSAAIYPCILALVGGAVSLFLVGYVVPSFAQIYQGTGRSLPFLSRLLMDWGRFAGAHAAPLAAGIATLAVLLALGVRQAVRRGGVGRLLALIPGMAARVRIYELSRLYLTMGMLLEGGITVVAAMISIQGMMSADVAARLRRACEAVQAGTPLSDAFEAQGLATPISLRMLRVGERSGELGAMLTRSAEFYDGEIGRWIDRFTRVFEPLLMAAIGIIVGAIVVLLYMPIFDLADSLQ
ncbi:type II secretion system F family protein [Nitrospirillum sp. BR 11164]|uniref:type II secretion system F family protein n=1 Tax=Nitrospirillum sp. BR 11164 TaxID=3104324 RepID=UPI002AFF32C7|nr:type II secretion system F family protein [Nitrospirillum sp. BR 11164]MEA1648663.1 type II secretion system F family protein [Nitrospirillum sp. BR 11164]